MHLILVINTGSTSIRLALYRGADREAEKSFSFAGVSDSRRTDLVVSRAEEFLEENGFSVGDLDAVSVRGGILRPLKGGVYRVNRAMLADLEDEKRGRHPSNLSALAGNELASGKVELFVVDPPVTDEMEEEARITGIPGIARRSIFHALSQKEAARRVAAALGGNYEDLNIIVIHMGGGISVGAHRGGRVVDVNNALDGDGPIAPERAGAVPAGELADMCFSGRYTRDEIGRMFTGEGGIRAYLGTRDMKEVERMIQDGDKMAIKTVNAMAYSIARETGALVPALGGSVDGIAVTGGAAEWGRLVELVVSRINFIARVFVYPGSLEMDALAGGALRVLSGREEALEY